MRLLLVNVARGNMRPTSPAGKQRGDWGDRFPQGYLLLLDCGKFSLLKPLATRVSKSGFRGDSMSIFPACDMFHGVKVIRPRTVSDRAADRGTSGQHGQKSIGFGGIPTSIFAARKSQVSIHLPCLPLTRFSRNSHKNVVVFLLCCWPFNYRISQPYSVFCALFLCGYVVAQDTHIYLRN